MVLTNTTAALFEVIHNYLILLRHVVGSRSFAVNILVGLRFPFSSIFFLVTYMTLVRFFSLFLILHNVPWIFWHDSQKKKLFALLPYFSIFDFFFLSKILFCVVFS